MNAQESLELSRFMDELNRHIRDHIALHGASLSFGTVTTTSPLTVTIDGSATAAPANHDASYTPVVGHRVYLHGVRYQYVVGGQVV